MKSLKELGFKIIGGQILTRIKDLKGISEDEIEKNRGILEPNCFSNEFLEEENIQFIDVYSKYNKDKITRVNDIVLKMNFPHTAFLITPRTSNLLVSSFCSILRPPADINIDLNYLIAYLNSDFIYDYFSQKLGFNKNMLRLKTIEDLPVAIIAKEKQIYIGNSYKKIMMFKKTTNCLIKLEKELFCSIIEKETSK